MIARKDRRHLLEQGAERDPVGTDAAAGVFLGRVVCVDTGEPVTLTHRGQGSQRVGPDTRRNARQHGAPLALRGTAVRTAQQSD